MTLLTGGAIATLVRSLIVSAVARQAIRRQAHLAGGLHVARGALNGRVAPAQRKTCSAVIEALGVPIDRRVALTTIGTEATVMRVVVLVTSDTSGRRAVVALVGMTGHASRSQVSADERKLRA